MTHDQLVHRAIKWLWDRGCSVVISEMTSGTSETPDVIGFTSTYSVIIECKVSYSDFLKDRHKPYFRCREFMGDKRYYLTPPKTVQQDKIPAGWGLLEVTDCYVKKTLEAAYKQANKQAECIMLMSALRRLEISTAVYVIHSEDVK